MQASYSSQRISIWSASYPSRRTRAPAPSVTQPTKANGVPNSARARLTSSIRSVGTAAATVSEEIVFKGSNWKAWTRWETTRRTMATIRKPVWPRDFSVHATGRPRGDRAGRYCFWPGYCVHRPRRRWRARRPPLPPPSRSDPDAGSALASATRSGKVPLSADLSASH
jgi:hypothetical protein